MGTAPLCGARGGKGGAEVSTDGLLWGMVIAIPGAPLLLLLALSPLIRTKRKDEGRHRR